MIYIIFIWFYQIARGIYDILNFRKFIYFVRLYFYKYCYILVFIGNENKQMWFASNKEVRLMIEIGYLISIIYLLYYALLGTTIIAIALIIALAIILSKSE